MQIRNVFDNNGVTFLEEEIKTGLLKDFSFHVSLKLLLFVVIVLYSRNKLFPQYPYSRVLRNSSNVSKLKTQSSILKT